MWQAFNYKSSDFDGMLRLTKDFYGDIEISDENFIKWEYFKNPAGEAIIKFAKNEDKEIVGQYVLDTMFVKVFNKQLKATLSLNTLTKKEFLRQGIFETLGKEAFKTCEDEQYAFTYGYPNQNSHPGFIKKLNFIDLHKIPLLIYPCNVKSLVKKKINKTLALFVPNIFFSLNKKTNGMNIIDLKEEDLASLDVFWEEIKDKYSIMVVRNKDFLKWRYMDIPIRKYSIFAYKRDNKIIGYIVAIIKVVDGIKNGMIVDFLIKDNEIEIGKKLIFRCFEMFRQNDVELLGCLMLEHTVEYKILKKCGFIRCPKFLEPQPFPLIYRAHIEEYDTEQMKDINNWFVSMGDYDVI